MVGVVIFTGYIDVKETHDFTTLAEANEFLHKEGFTFDYDDGAMDHWKFDDYTSATVFCEMDE